MTSDPTWTPSGGLVEAAAPAASEAAQWLWLVLSDRAKDDYRRSVTAALSAAVAYRTPDGDPELVPWEQVRELVAYAAHHRSCPASHGLGHLDPEDANRLDEYDSRVRRWRAVLGEQEATPECTGLAATWCPVHGDCTCRPYGPGVADHKDDPTCPLHAPSSPHGEPVGEQEATPPECEYDAVGRCTIEHDHGVTLPVAAPQGEAEPPKGAA